MKYDYPGKDMMETAIGGTRIVDMLTGEPVKPETTVFDVELVVRASTAPPRT